MALGILTFIVGLMDYRMKRRIQDIPTSKIKSVAMGQLVEIQGVVCRDEYDLIVAPLSKHKCIVYWWQIEEEISDRRRDNWVCRHTLYSSRYFFIDDGSGANAAIDLKHVYFNDQPSPDYYYDLTGASSGILNKLKKNGLTQYNEDNGIFRIKENYISIGKTVYALGSTYPSSKLKKGRYHGADTTFLVKKETLVKKVVERINFLSNFNAIRKKYDLNHDHRLDKSEIKNMYKDAGKQVHKEYRSKVKSLYDNNAIVLGKSRNRMSIVDKPKVQVSFSSEGAFIFKLEIGSIFRMVAGAILFSAGMIGVFKLMGNM